MKFFLGWCTYCIAPLILSSAVFAKNISNLPPGIKTPDRLGIRKQKLPELKPKKANPAPEFELPPVRILPEQKRLLSMQPKIWVRKILLKGNTVFSEHRLKELIAPFEGREISNEMLQTLRINLTRYYVDRGFINSGAIIPDQDINNGVIVIYIIEGKLKEIQVTGNNWLRTSYIKKRIARGVETPLNINPLRQQLQLLQQDPLLDQISARLKPGMLPGESELKIKVKEARPYQIGLTISNDRSPSIGAENGRVWAVHRNLTGFGDRLYASYNLSEGLHNYAASYSFPLTAYDTRLQFSYDRSDSEIITRFTNSESEPKITGESEMYEISLYQPAFQTPQQTIALTLAFQHRRSQTFLGDEGFGFSAGVANNGISKISAIRFTQDWINRGQDQVIAFRSRFSFGINAFDSTINTSGPDSRFFTWLGQIQWLRRLSLFDSQLLLRADMQFSADPLLPLEKFSVGGQYSVRGYRENQLVRDNGISSSLEWRVPIFRLPIPMLSQNSDDGQVQFATFFDFGWSENLDLPNPNPKTISSAGIGVRWSPSRKIHSQLYWAIPFRKIENDPHDLQDSGIHFRVSMELF